MHAWICFIDPEDYLDSRLIFSFSAPLPAQSVICDNITIVNDGVVEPCEDFVVSISSSSERAAVVGDNSSIVQINDDEGKACIIVLHAVMYTDCQNF